MLKKYKTPKFIDVLSYFYILVEWMEGNDSQMLDLVHRAANLRQ